MRNNVSKILSLLSFFTLKKLTVILLVATIFLFCVAASFFETNTFIIYDGEDKAVYNSKQRNTSDFLIEEEITVPEDKYLEMPEKAENGFAEIFLLKKNVLTVNVDGETKTLYALKDTTISDVLAQNGITLGNEDTLSVPLSSPATDGLAFKITRFLTKTVEEYQDIPFPTEKRPQSNLNKGTSKVITKGVKGSKKLVYSVKLENGKEIERKLLSETVTKKPSAEIVEYGTHEVDKSGSVTTFSGSKLEYKKVLNMTATAYTTERTSDKITATGQVARVGLVAVDPKVIPLGSRLYICSPDGKSWSYGTAVAGDTGVRGNVIDLFFDTYKECISFGRRKAIVYVLK